MSKDTVKPTTVDMVLSGKIPNLRGLSAITIENNFKPENRKAIVTSINKARDYGSGAASMAKLLFPLSVAVLGLGVFAFCHEKIAGLVTIGGALYLMGMGFFELYEYRTAQIYDEAATNHLINNRTK